MASSYTVYRNKTKNLSPLKTEVCEVQFLILGVLRLGQVGIREKERERKREGGGEGSCCPCLSQTVQKCTTNPPNSVTSVQPLKLYYLLMHS